MESSIGFFSIPGDEALLFGKPNKEGKTFHGVNFAYEFHKGQKDSDEFKLARKFWIPRLAEFVEQNKGYEMIKPGTGSGVFKVLHTGTVV